MNEFIFFFLIQLLQFLLHGRISFLTNNKRLFLQSEISLLLPNFFLDGGESSLEQLEAHILSVRGSSHDVEWWSDQGEVNFDLVCGASFTGSESFLNGVDSFLGEASEFEMGADLDWLWLESSNNFSLELGLDFVVDFSDSFEQSIWFTKFVRIGMVW